MVIELSIIRQLERFRTVGMRTVNVQKFRKISLNILKCRSSELKFTKYLSQYCSNQQQSYPSLVCLVNLGLKV